ncbi:MAG: PH domain-containing protein [Chitinophagales bacterium]|nr:PH domain-containing protein [Chitinophagales bacterium]
MEKPMVFRSKIGLEILLPVCLIFGVVAYAMLFAGKVSWPGLLIVLCGATFVFYTLWNIIYTIKDGQLHIRCGFFRYPPVSIREIKQVKKTNNPLSAPAASLDRLEIRVGRQVMLVSPKDKQGFIEALKSVNPEIIYPEK